MSKEGKRGCTTQNVHDSGRGGDPIGSGHGGQHRRGVGCRGGCSGRTPLKGSAVTATARKHAVGAVAKSARVSFELVLKLRDASGAQSLVRAISSPGSASYRHYLTASQWESRFSPASKCGQQRPFVAGQRRLQGGGRVQGPDHHLRLRNRGPGREGVRHHAEELQAARPHGAHGRQHHVRPGLAQRQRGGRPGHQPEHRHDRQYVRERGEHPRRARRPRRTRSRQRRPRSSPPRRAAAPTGPKIDDTSPRRSARATPARCLTRCAATSPASCRSAYNVGSTSTGKGVTVAIIDAYGSATIAQRRRLGTSAHERSGQPVQRTRISARSTRHHSRTRLSATLLAG